MLLFGSEAQRAVLSPCPPQTPQTDPNSESSHLQKFSEDNRGWVHQREGEYRALGSDLVQWSGEEPSAAKRGQDQGDGDRLQAAWPYSTRSILG